jgi:aminoglycoside 3-N-acetyltransferase
MSEADNSKERIIHDCRVLGLVEGDLLMVHSSYKSLGHVYGGIETVIQALLETIGKTGTLLMPALSWNIQPGDLFDPVLTPSIVGAVSEYFRKRVGTQRSFHPSHSVCGVGYRVAEMLDDHVNDITPCGEHSPFRKITEQKGKILMLGCGLKPNTTMHALEEFTIPPYLFGQDRLIYMKTPDGFIINKLYKWHNFRGWEQRYDRVELLQGDFIRSGYVLQAKSALLDAQKLRQAVLSKMTEDQLFFVDRVKD